VADGAVTGTADDELAATYDDAGLTADQLARFPALTGFLALHLSAGGDAVRHALTGQLRLSVATGSGDDATLVAFTGVQIPGVLDDLYATAAATRALGVSWKRGVPTLAVWAPTAQQVSVLLDPASSGGTAQSLAATRQSDGTWTLAGKSSWKNRGYLYELTVPAAEGVVVNQVTDPYSVALTTNSTRSVIVDLDDASLAPRQWSTTASPTIANESARTIYELHVRDFSETDTSVPPALRGTYDAFALTGTNGMNHLAALAKAGLNTVQLQPVFDFATVNEDRTTWQEPACDLPSLPPSSDTQQACTSAVASTDGFNWGYDPFHYLAAEGSYAVNPNGGARVRELRTMVGGLHAAGLQVVVDQVFNHTSASGQSDASVLDRVVPGYYQRLDAKGAVYTSTCCSNVATEHAMAGKLMVDGVVLWAEQYKVDGFRFDLMGFHSVENMEAVRAALDALTPRKNGVDGTKIALYGEGWNFGEVANNALFTQAIQGQLGGTGIGTFNDRLRDGVRGGSPVDSSSVQKQGWGSGLGTDPNGLAVNGTPDEQAAALAHAEDLVKVGLAGNLSGFEFLSSASGTTIRGDEVDYNGSPAGYADEPDETLNYVDAHDNQTLYDALALKLPASTTMSDRVRMQVLSLSAATLSQSRSMWLAGSDLLRSKSMDNDSYDSGDWFNRIDWTGVDNTWGSGLPPAAKNSSQWPVMAPLLADPALEPTAEAMASASAQAATLLSLKASTPLFSLDDAAAIQAKVTFPEADPGVIVMSIDDRLGTDADPRLDGVLVVFNAETTATTTTISALAGRGYALSSLQAAGSDPVVKTTTWDASTGTVTVPARTVAVLVQKAAPTLTVSPSAVRPGQWVSVTGTGFGANDRVRVTVGSSVFPSAVVWADRSGAFRTIVVAPWRSGTVPVRAVGSPSGSSATAQLTVTSGWWCPKR
jgi:pullulanase-type alpha-1,6-glucosidase